MPNGGVCSRCLGLPYCRICKRHLASICFDESNVGPVQFTPSGRLFNVLGTNRNKQSSHTDYCLFASGMQTANEEDLASRAPSTTSSTKFSCLLVQKTHPSTTFYIATQTKSIELSTSTWNDMGTFLVPPTVLSIFFFFVYMTKLKFLLFCVLLSNRSIVS